MRLLKRKPGSDHFVPVTVALSPVALSQKMVWPFRKRKARLLKETGFWNAMSVVPIAPKELRISVRRPLPGADRTYCLPIAPPVAPSVSLVVISRALNVVESRDGGHNRHAGRAKGANKVAASRNA